ncbi:unnamed protein product [Toxocara canis]|uniref:Secreted protein n=1 Tax=Toxocara canis TaxID=6265 RepID=A0A183U333_TOXCA|nr:unnamed protein product [Toxocara canis]
MHIPAPFIIILQGCSVEVLSWLLTRKEENACPRERTASNVTGVIRRMGDRRIGDRRIGLGMDHGTDHGIDHGILHGVPMDDETGGWHHSSDVVDELERLFSTGTTVLSFQHIHICIFECNREIKR